MTQPIAHPISTTDDVVWDPSIYPRAKWSTATVDRYAEAMEAGDVFPAVIAEKGTHKLLDGKHRMLAAEKAGVTLDVEYRVVPEGMSARYYAATLSARHGDRMSNADLKALARSDFEDDPTLSTVKYAAGIGVADRTVREWVSDITGRARSQRSSKAWRLSKLGWTQAEIGELLGVARSVVSEDVGNGNLAEFDTLIGADWNDQGLAEQAHRLALNPTDAWAAALAGMDDEQRLARLGIKTQPYDVWHFNSCHDLMGDAHPGRVPGEIMAHLMWLYTKPGDLIVDPMAGSGTTLDAALLLGRKARGYDIDQRHDRIDIEQHNLDNGWPATVTKAQLVFWDPPYFDKMDSATIGSDGYIEGSISGKSPDDYMAWFGERFTELKATMPDGARLAFLMSDWDAQGSKKWPKHPGLFIWDYADLMRDAGFKLERQIQIPLPTQQIHPDIVNKHRAARRLGRLGRWLVVAR